MTTERRKRQSRLVCTEFGCDKKPLTKLKAHQFVVTRRGHYTAVKDVLVCSKCGGCYGGW